MLGWILKNCNKKLNIHQKYFTFLNSAEFFSNSAEHFSNSANFAELKKCSAEFELSSAVKQTQFAYNHVEIRCPNISWFSTNKKLNLKKRKKTIRIHISFWFFFRQLKAHFSDIRNISSIQTFLEFFCVHLSSVFWRW